MILMYVSKSTYAAALIEYYELCSPSVSKDSSAGVLSSHRTWTQTMVGPGNAGFGTPSSQLSMVNGREPNMKGVGRLFWGASGNHTGAVQKVPGPLPRPLLSLSLPNLI